MKKIILLMPLMALTTLTSCGKPFDPNKIDLYKKAYVYNSDGKTLESTTTYTYNEQDLVVEEITSYEGSTEVIKCSYIYDEHENVKEETTTIYTDGEITETCTSLASNKYDTQGRLIYTYFINSYSFETTETTITYGDHTKLVDKITRSLFFANRGKTRNINLYTYNDKGHIINEKYLNEIAVNDNDINFLNEIVYELDQNECATTIKDYRLNLDGEREYLESETTVTYLNNLYYRPIKTRMVRYNPNSGASYIEEHEYDEQNRQTLYKSYYEDTDAYQFYFTYEY